MLLHQLGGANAVSSYGSSIFVDAGKLKDFYYGSSIFE